MISKRSPAPQSERKTRVKTKKTQSSPAAASDQKASPSKAPAKSPAKSSAKSPVKASLKSPVTPQTPLKAPTKPKRQRAASKTKLALAGVGASAGGLEALRLFVADLPKNVNMSYVIAQHMSPQHRSMMVDLLSRETQLAVFEVKNGTVPKPDTVYVGPPNSDVFVKGGKLRLRKPLSDIGAKPSVDYLFSSMAEEFGERAIGIVMSGTGSDGSHGIRAINAAGGICIAQDPETAKYDSMPRSAIKAGVDLVLPPADIAAQLASIVSHPRVKVTGIDANLDPASPVESIIKNIYGRTRMDFSNYKEATITRQIERRMAVLQMRDLAQYVKFSEDKPGELEALTNNFLICVTSFFRDKQAFDAFRDVIRDTLETKKPGDEIRIWVPGCATGEEAYSIAIILAEELGNRLGEYKVQVFATDVNPQATQFGRKGLYPETSIENLDPAILKKYFLPKDRFFQVDRKIRDLVVFANQDLVQDPPFVRVDAITCRNLLIYFKTGLQEKVFRIFHYALNPNGIMFLGQSESIGQNTNLFLDVNRKLKLFRKRDVPSAMPSALSRIPLAELQSRRQTAKSITSAADTPIDPGRDVLFNAYAPPSVLVSEDGSIMEFYGDVTPFMKLKPGKADFSMFSIIHPPLRTELRAIIQKVVRSRETTYTHPVSLTVNGEERMYRTAVRPIESKMLGERLVLVSFEVVQLRTSSPFITDDIDETAETRISELEHELTMTRESLQTVIEELETSNEELQSMNEESQAANEELQASNEELETSNEELQATNEELTTVNDELSLRTHELAEAMDDMENIQNSSDLATIVVDRDMTIRRQNKRSQDFFKTTPELFTQNLTSVPILFELDGFLDRVRKVSTTDQPFEAEFSLGDRHFEVQVFPYQTSQPDSRGGAVINIRDISERSHADAMIKESEQRFHAVIDNASSEIMLKDIDGHCLLVNKKFLENHKLKEEDIIGKRLNDIYDASVYAPFNDLSKKVLSSGTYQQRELSVPLGHYPFTALLSTQFPIRDTSGKIINIGMINTDISDMQKAIRELEDAKRQADTANKAKSQFLSSMSHELRTPLNAILGFGQLLELDGNAFTTKQKEHIGYVLDGGRHLLDLINQVLDLARIESGAVSLSIEPLAIDNVISPCVVMANSLAKRFGVTVINNCKPPKGAMVQADLTRSKQVLLNLLSNAIKYNTAQGTVTLDCQKTANGMWRFSVRDTGLGIALDQQTEVFRPFYRLALNKTTVEGTGIGLAISKELVETMGGNIGFESVEGIGSMFWFELPLSSKQSVAKMTERAGRETKAFVSLVQFPPNTKVLYIEDNPQNQNLMKSLIQRLEGLTLITASNAEEGLKLCRAKRPNIVLMDIHLPGINGIDATRILKEDAKLKDIPVIAVSANAMESDIRAAMDAGICEYVTKPFNIDDIALAIRRALS